MKVTGILRAGFVASFLMPLLASADSNLSVYGVTSSGSVVRFASNAPGAILSSAPISGLQSGESFVGLDFRPNGGQLYGVTNQSRLYRLDPLNGATTVVGTPFSSSLTGAQFGSDINPAADRMRVTGNDAQNLRINPETGELVAADTALTYASGDPNFGAAPNITAVAYSNNLAGVAATTLLGIDGTLGTLVRIGGPNGTPSPNTGEVTTLGSLGLGTNLTGLSFDIVPGKTLGSQVGLLAAILNGESVTKLFSVDLAGGSATLIGAVGDSLSLVGMAANVADDVAPIGLVRVVQRIRIQALTRQPLVATVSCSELCTLNATLEFTENASRRLDLPGSGAVQIATAAGSLADSGTTELSFTISEAARSALSASAARGARRFRMILTVTITDAGNNSTAVVTPVETI